MWEFSFISRSKVGINTCQSILQIMKLKTQMEKFYWKKYKTFLKRRKTYFVWVGAHYENNSLQVNIWMYYMTLIWESTGSGLHRGQWKEKGGERGRNRLHWSLSVEMARIRDIVTARDKVSQAERGGGKTRTWNLFCGWPFSDHRWLLSKAEWGRIHINKDRTSFHSSLCTGW